jgi:phosphoribosyl-ATP pyrophosphohydrolase
MTISNEVMPIFIAQQMSIYQYKYIEEAAEDIIVKTNSMKQEAIKENKDLLKFIYWWP